MFSQELGRLNITGSAQKLGPTNKVKVRGRTLDIIARYGRTNDKQGTFQARKCLRGVGMRGKKNMELLVDRVQVLKKRFGKFPGQING